MQKEERRGSRVEFAILNFGGERQIGAAVLPAICVITKDYFFIFIFLLFLNLARWCEKRGEKFLKTIFGVLRGTKGLRISPSCFFLPHLSLF